VLPIRNGNLYGGVRPRKAGLGRCLTNVCPVRVAQRTLLAQVAQLN
jgi:hypothetical protein